jgi:hypothetical protein
MAAINILSRRSLQVLLTACLVAGLLPGCRGSRCGGHNRQYESSGYSVDPYYPSGPQHEIPYYPEGSQPRSYEPVPMLGVPDAGHTSPQLQPAPSGAPMGPEIRGPRKFPGDEAGTLDQNSAYRSREPRTLRDRISGWFKTQNVSHPAGGRHAVGPYYSAERKIEPRRPLPGPNDRVAERTPPQPIYAPASREVRVAPAESQLRSPVMPELTDNRPNKPVAVPIQRASAGSIPEESATQPAPRSAARPPLKPVDAKDPLLALPPWPEGPAGKARAHDYFERIPETTPNQFQPMRVIEPPTLQSPPTLPDAEAATAQSARLAIPRIALCREVRSFDDVDEFDRRQLRCGQPVLLYSSLTGFESMPTSSGYRTLTLSSLEIRNDAGQVVSTHDMGTATDLTTTPRRDYFLTHQLRLPAELGAGNYVLELTVNDLIGKQTAKAQLAISVAVR